MKTFWDTSAAINALVSPDVFKRLNDGEHFARVHLLSEFFSTMTGRGISVTDLKPRLTATPFWCLLLPMKKITSKVLHEQTGHCLDRVKEGERLQIIRNGKLSALLVPPESEHDPEWPEIMRDVWEAQKEGGPLQSNPVLKKRARRKYAAGLR